MTTSHNYTSNLDTNSIQLGRDRRSNVSVQTRNSRGATPLPAMAQANSQHLCPTMGADSVPTDLYIVVEGDKNLGPCILDRAIYVERGCSDHLGNSTNYRELNDTWVQLFKKKLDYRFEAWLTKYHTRLKQISKAEATFFRRAREQNPDQLARFRMTAKVHKTPWKTRPIVCCAGTWMNAWSKWLDYWLQKLKPFVKTFVKDSQQTIDEISTLELPQYALLVTCDANSMYNNIDTAHAIEVISKWL